MSDSSTQPELKRIANSLENIEKIVTRFYTVQSMPTMVIKTNDSPPPVEDDDIPEPTILDYSLLSWFKKRK